MSQREMLMARKHAVRRELERLQRELDTLRGQSPPPARRISRLEAQSERLMAEEFNLRLAIDRSSRI